MKKTALLTLMVLAQFMASAVDVTLAWSPSPDPVSGYTLHYGTLSGIYTASLPAGLDLTSTVIGLDPGTLYYFAVTATGTNSLVSDYSNEVAWGVPVPPAPPVLLGTNYVKLTPWMKRSVDGGPWVEVPMSPTFVPATNSSELFLGLQIEKQE